MVLPVKTMTTQKFVIAVKNIKTVIFYFYFFFLEGSNGEYYSGIHWTDLIQARKSAQAQVQDHFNVRPTPQLN